MLKLLVLTLLLAGVAIAMPQEAAEAKPAEPTAAEAPAEGAEAETAAVESGATDAVTKAEQKTCSCADVIARHYTAMSCEPVMEEISPGCSCAARYNCKSEEERNVPLTSCVYEDKIYNVGDSLTVRGPCRRGCKCVASIDPKEPAKIECAIVECHSSSFPPKPGCRLQYNINKCCEVSQDCLAPVPEGEAPPPPKERDCFSEGLEYYHGDKMTFTQAPCQLCVCSEGFTGPYGPNCTKLDCGMEYRDRLHLRNGCTPIYSPGICCPTDWVCPGSPQIVIDPELAIKGDEGENHCIFGKDQATAKGQFLKTYNCEVNCGCLQPPAFTCIQYATCELALAAKRSFNVF